MASWREICARSPTGRHHWAQFEYAHVHPVDRLQRQKKKVVRFFLTCQYCLFRTSGEIDFQKKEVRVRK